MESDEKNTAQEDQTERARTALRILKLHHTHQKKVRAARQKLAGEVRAALAAELPPGADELEWPALAAAAAIVITLAHDLQNQVLAKLPEEIREQMVEQLYSFSSIPRLDGRQVQKLLRQVEARVLATSLIDSEPDVYETITSNMSSRARAMLEEDIDSLVRNGELSRRDLQEARGTVSSALYDLYESGELGAKNE